MKLMEDHLRLGGHVRRNSLLLLIFFTYSLSLVVAEKATSLEENDTQELVHFFAQRGIRVPSSAAKMEVWRSFMTEDSFRRLRNQHRVWLKKVQTTSSAAFKDVIPDFKAVIANQRQQRPITAAPRVPAKPVVARLIPKDAEKDSVGKAPMKPAGIAAKESVGNAAKEPVGIAVKESVGNAAKESVGIAAKEPVGIAAKDSVVNVVKESVGNAVKDPVGNAVKESVGNAAKDSVGNAAKEPVANAAKDSEAVVADEVQPHSDSVVLFDTSFGFADHPNNEFHMWRAPFPSFGQPWPMPMQMSISNERFFRLDRTRLAFRASGESNYILLTAFSRTREVLGEMLAASYYPKQWSHQESHVGRLAAGGIHNVEVRVRQQGRAWPHLHMDESYKLTVDSSGVRIFANETWGALHGLETFSQLIWQTRDNAFYINKTAITDRPRFKHRGMLVDTGRHFIRKEIFLKNLDGMAYNKMNVLHWHMVDDQSFPFQSQTFPNLSNQGAYDRTHMVYTPDDVREILEYARERGIRVIPEFDSPGHTYSWGKGYPHLLTKCYDRDTWSGYYGPLNPARTSTFAFLSKFFEEIVETFHDDYIHLGADEVGTKCWESNPEVVKLMQRFGLDRMELVTDYFLRKLQNVITRLGLKDKAKKRGYIVWQEARDSGVLLKSGTIVQVWKGDSPLDGHTVARAGQRVLYSACWYMDRVEYGSQWMKYYQCDPGPDSVSEGHEPWHDNLLGGEACMWSEYQTDDTILQRIWPLASATAERLWSPASVNSIERAGPRLEEHRCRMNMRGIPASAPSGPGTCAYHNVTPAASPLKFRARNIRNHVNEPAPMRSSFDLVDSDAYLTTGYEHYKFSTMLLLLLIFLFGGVGAVLALRKSRANLLPGSSPPAPLLFVVVRYMTMRRILTLLGAFLLFYVLVWILPVLVFPSQHHQPAAVLS